MKVLLVYNVRNPTRVISHNNYLYIYIIKMNRCIYIKYQLPKLNNLSYLSIEAAVSFQTKTIFIAIEFYNE